MLGLAAALLATPASALRLVPPLPGSARGGRSYHHRHGMAGGRTLRMQGDGDGEDAAAPPPKTTTPAVAPPSDRCRRVVAIGDVHGDLDALHRTLLMSGVCKWDQSRDAPGWASFDVWKDEDECDDAPPPTFFGAQLAKVSGGLEWCGGKSIVVQCGDLLDRGDEELQVMECMADLAHQAEEAGGQVITLLGNHEIMNALGDLRYTSPQGDLSFAALEGVVLNELGGSWEPPEAEEEEEAEEAEGEGGGEAGVARVSRAELRKATAGASKSPTPASSPLERPSPPSLSRRASHETVTGTPFSEIPYPQRVRAAAFAPGGVLARRISKWPVAVIIDRTLYVHAGMAIGLLFGEQGEWLGSILRRLPTTSNRLPTSPCASCSFRTL